MPRTEYYHQQGAPQANVVVPCVFATVSDPAGRVLLVRRVDSGNWEMPGGAIEPGESMPDTLRREVLEESGLIVSCGPVAGVFCDPGHVLAYPDGQIRQQLVVCVHATPIGGTPRPDWHETDAVGWFALDELAALPIHPSVRERLRHAVIQLAPPVALGRAG